MFADCSVCTCEGETDRGRRRERGALPSRNVFVYVRTVFTPVLFSSGAKRVMCLEYKDLNGSRTYSKSDLDPNLGLPLACCVIFGKFLNFSECLFFLSVSF